MKIQQRISEAVLQTPKVLQFEISLRESCRRKMKGFKKRREHDGTLERLIFDFRNNIYSSISEVGLRYDTREV